MACFLVPTAEAIVTTVIEKKVAKSEPEAETADGKPTMKTKLHWLNMLLWGGAGLLLIEHMWHGEVVPWFPFLTAMSSPDDTAAMLHEMSTVGVGMAILVTAVWIVACLIIDNAPAVRRALMAPAANEA